MSFIHIVILKFKSETVEAEIAACFNALSALLSEKKIAGLVEYSGGVYDSPEGMNKGFTHAFVMKFVDRESRDNYFPHPEHEKVKDMLASKVDEVLCFDYAV